jgi:hypothetical protein
LDGRDEPSTVTLHCYEHVAGGGLQRQPDDADKRIGHEGAEGAIRTGQVLHGRDTDIAILAVGADGGIDGSMAIVERRRVAYDLGPWAESKR